MPKTEAQKLSQQKWIEKNKEKYYEYQRIYALEYYYKNRENILAKLAEKNKQKKEQEL